MIEINNLTKILIDKKPLTEVAKIVLKGENTGKGKELSIVFINKSKIKELNKKYRNKDEATDVLSFTLNSKLQRKTKNPFDGEMLGEVIICLEVVKKNAKIDKSNFKKELSFVLIHGILHLIGYDHEKSKKEAEEMRKKEEYYLSKMSN